MGEKKAAPEVEAPGRYEELKRLAQPLVDYLRKYHHPHTAIIITDDWVDVLESLVGIPFPFLEN